MSDAQSTNRSTSRSTYSTPFAISSDIGDSLSSIRTCRSASCSFVIDREFSANSASVIATSSGEKCIYER